MLFSFLFRVANLVLFAEPRRSVRSTKGVNNRLSDIGTADVASPTPNAPVASKSRKKSTAKGRVTPPPPQSESPKNEAEEKGGSDDIIRCACGATEEDEDDDRMMIQCEGCEAWQHTACMGIAKKHIPKVYFCEVCRPDLHQNLLAQMAKGEKPWEKRPGGRRVKGAKGAKGAKGGKKGTTPAKNQKNEVTPTRNPKKKEPTPVPVPPKEPTPVPEPKVTPAKKATPRRKKAEVRKEPEPVAEPIVEAPVAIEEDKMDVDVPVAPDAPAEQTPAPAEPSEEIDRERTVSMELSPAKEAEILGAKKPTAVVEIPADPKTVGFAKSPVMSRIDDSLPKSPLAKSKDHRPKVESRRDSVVSNKRKATDESDGEYKADDDKVLSQGPQPQIVSADRQKQQPEKKARRVSSATAASVDATPTKTTPERRHSSVQKPPPKKLKQEDNTPQKELVGSVDELRNESRRKVVAHMISSLLEIATKLVNEHDLHLGKDQTAEQLCDKLCLEVEHHVYLIFFKDGALSKEYSRRLLSITRNLRANSLLSTELLRGGVEPAQLAAMTSEQMASKELKEFQQQVRLQSEKHHTLITETGPRIRRTHKGEEVVGELKEGMSNGQDTLLSGPVLPLLEHNEKPATSSKSPTEDPKDTSATPDQADTEQGARPAPIDTKSAEKNQFNIENVWNHVESPDTDKVPRPFGLGIAPPSARVAGDSKIDKDIDMLLKEDDGTGTPPYSPAMSESDHYSPAPIEEESMWRGRVEMNGIASLSSTARLIGGLEYIGSSKWYELLSDVLQVDGRIKHDRATEYLCGQKFSKSSSLIMASLTPTDSNADREFNLLFDYFKERDRYAVVGKHALKCIKDLYIVPIDTNDNLPDWFNVLDPPPTVPESGRERRLLVIIFVVIRSHVGLPTTAPTPTTSESPYPQQQQPPQHSRLAEQPYASPITHTPQAQYHQQSAYSPQTPQPQQQQQQQQPPIYNYPTAPSTSPPHHQQQQQQPAYNTYPYPTHNGNSTSPPPAAASTPGPAQEIELLQMARDLQRMIPDLPLDQLLVINNMLRENPEMQTNDQEIVKLVEAHLGGSGGGGGVY